MKIVVSGYVGKKITGIGRNLICLLDNICSNNQFVIYTNADMIDDLVFKNSNIKIRTYNVRKGNSMGNLLWTTFIFPFKVLKEHADMALIPNFTLLLFKFRPTVVIMHDLIEFNVPNKFSKLKMFYRTKIADPITAKRADHIITVSNNSKRDIINFLKVKEEKISVVYNGVDQKRFHRIDRSDALKTVSEKQWPYKFILYVGTIDHPGKNVMTVVKAFEQIKVRDKYTGALILAGMPGSGYDILEDYIRKSDYRKDIVETGFVSDKELVALYSLCDVFCFVSLYEGFGIPPLEALACGAKVIVSNTSSLPEVVGKSGLLIDPLDVESLVYNIEEMLCGTWKLDESILKEHVANYQWEELSRQFEIALYRGLGMPN